MYEHEYSVETELPSLPDAEQDMDMLKESQLIPADVLAALNFYREEDCALEPIDEEMDDEPWTEISTPPPPPPIKSRESRHRFISSFKVNRLGRATEVDWRWIDECQYVSYWADCKLDAALYDPGLDVRTDIDVYISLYGLHPFLVHDIDYEPTIMALDQYATVVASDDQVASDVFLRRFVDLLDALEQSNYPSGYLEIDPSPVSMAYMAFLNTLDSDVTTADEELW